MNPKIESALRALPFAALMALVAYLFKIKNSVAAALVRRDKAEAESEKLRGELATTRADLEVAQRMATELQSEVDTARKERDAAMTRAGFKATCAREAAAEAAVLRRAFYCAVVAGLREGSPDDALAPFEKYEDSQGLALLKELGGHRQRAEKLARACKRAADWIDGMAFVNEGLDGDAEGKNAEARALAAKLRALASDTGETPPAQGERLDVVSAVIVVDGYLLLAKRLPTAAFPDLYETPGGKVEKGETARTALAREIKEELGVDCEVGEVLWTVPADPPVVSRPLQITFFRVSIKGGVPQALAAEALLWASREEVLSLPMLPGNSAMRAELAALCEPARISPEAVREAAAEVARETATAAEDFTGASLANDAIPTLADAQREGRVLTIPVGDMKEFMSRLPATWRVASDDDSNLEAWDIRYAHPLGAADYLVWGDSDRAKDFIKAKLAVRARIGKYHRVGRPLAAVRAALGALVSTSDVMPASSAGEDPNACLVRPMTESASIWLQNQAADGVSVTHKGRPLGSEGT